MTRKPNILFIMPDQQRADMLGSYGDQAARSSATDWLASEGVQFQNCFCQAPLCMPSRASLLTERYVRDHGVFQNVTRVNDTVPTCPQSLQAAGYHTAQIGKTHLYTHLPWPGGHMNGQAGILHHYGFTETHETAGKEASLRVDSLYTDYLQKHGLLEEYRTYLASRNKHVLEDNPEMEAAKAWNADPLPLPPHAHQDVWVGDYAADWVRSYEREAPFFLQVCFAGPHDPWDAPEEALAEYGDPDMTMPGSFEPPEIPESGPLSVFLNVLTEYCDTGTMTPEAVAKARRAYQANTMMIDQGIGKIIDALRETGQLDNTWIIFTSDHGEMMGEHRMMKKMVFYDASVRVPLIVRPPGGMDPRTVDGIVELTDIAATFRDIAGADLPTSQFQSLLPAIDGQDVGKEVAISEAYGVAMFRTATRKLVVYEDTQEPMQFFNLENDPLEDRNLVLSGGAEEEIKAMMARYARPFLAIRPIRPARSLIERGSMAKNSFYLPDEVFVR
jgi:choline-sulfatase